MKRGISQRCGCAFDPRPLSEDEEDLVWRLHNLVGDRFALIAGRLPNRNAAEIEEYWNARHYRLTHSYKAPNTDDPSSRTASVSRDHRHAFSSQIVDQGNKQPSSGVLCEESVDSTSGFSEDEEALIRRLHALLGNRWSTMSRLVPGRSGKEIEEDWNRMEMRRRRAEEYPNALAHPT